MSTKRFYWWFCFILITFQASLLILIRHIHIAADPPINSDGRVYYAYLPALFIDHLLTITEPLKYEPAHFVYDHPGLINWQNSGTYLIKYPPGVAIMVSPFFLLARILTFYSAASGYSLIYNYLVGLAAPVYTSVALALLFRIYKQQTSSVASFITIFSIVFATNFLTYTVYSPLMSHAYTFFLISLVIYLTNRWWHQPNLKHTLVLGLSTSLAILTRNTHIALLVFILGFGLKQEPRPPLRHWLWLVTIIFLGLLPQFLYYYLVTGQFWVYAYVGEGFNWFDPAWYGTLFSPRRGLFFWSPIWLLCLFGLYPSRRRPWWFPNIFFLCLATYIIASWRLWSYGDGYGHRVFIDLYPFMGLFLTHAVQLFIKRRPTQIILALIVTTCIFINLKLQYLCWIGTLPHDHVFASQVLKLLLNPL